MSKPTIICLTPIKNESWILERFLRCTSIWADHIIVLDQNSDDGSQEIAKSFSKVLIIDNPNSSYNEFERQTLLIEAARKFREPRLLIALDADECISSNFVTSPEWKTVLDASPGTVIYFDWVNLKPNMSEYWTPPIKLPLGFMDDGSEHTGKKIHNNRVPVPLKSHKLILNTVKVLHYQYADWERMRSKHFWYQCWERLNNPKKSAIDVYREYHHMDAIPESDLKPVINSWFNEYLAQGIDMTSINKEPSYRWHQEVLAYLAHYGGSTFSKDSIWSVNWEQQAKEYAFQDLNQFKDPRGFLEKSLHVWLRKTQPHQNNIYVRLIDKILRKLF